MTLMVASEWERLLASHPDDTYSAYLVRGLSVSVLAMVPVGTSPTVKEKEVKEKDVVGQQAHQEARNRRKAL